MKRIIVAGMLAALAGCAMLKRPAPVEPVRTSAPAAVVQTGLRTLDGAPIEALPFRPGVSSVTVERLGRQQGCVSREGAGLMTPAGPVEVYKMVCESGKIFTARCELRQCKAM